MGTNSNNELALVGPGEDYVRDLGIGCTCTQCLEPKVNNYGRNYEARPNLGSTV